MTTLIQLYPFDHRRSFRIQLDRVPLMTLLLAVLQPTALVVLQHTVLTTEASGTETTIPYYPLRSIFAVFKGTPDFLGWHAASHWKREVQGRVGYDVERGERWVSECGGQVAAGVREAER